MEDNLKTVWVVTKEEFKVKWPRFTARITEQNIKAAEAGLSDRFLNELGKFNTLEEAQACFKAAIPKCTTDETRGGVIVEQLALSRQTVNEDGELWEYLDDYDIFRRPYVSRPATIFEGHDRDYPQPRFFLWKGTYCSLTIPYGVDPLTKSRYLRAWYTQATHETFPDLRNASSAPDLLDVYFTEEDARKGFSAAKGQCRSRAGFADILWLECIQMPGYPPDDPPTEEELKDVKETLLQAFWETLDYADERSLVDIYAVSPEEK